MTPNPKIPAGEDCMLVDTSPERNSTSHTPGPWTAMPKPSPSYSDHGWRSMAMCGSRWMVAAPASATRKVENGVIVEVTWDHEANARLMAAAPDLLKALIAVVSVADRKTDEFYLAHAAIAKATGVQA